jgi:hypothetical protein
MQQISQKYRNFESQVRYVPASVASAGVVGSGCRNHDHRHRGVCASSLLRHNAQSAHYHHPSHDQNHYAYHDREVQRVAEHVPQQPKTLALGNHRGHLPGFF